MSNDDAAREVSRTELLGKLEQLHLLGLGTVVAFEYVNHEGKHGTRRVRMTDIEFRIDWPHYPTTQWLMSGECLDRKACRRFAVSKMENIRAAELSNG